MKPHTVKLSTEDGSFSIVICAHGDQPTFTFDVTYEHDLSDTPGPDVSHHRNITIPEMQRLIDACQQSLTEALHNKKVKKL